MRASDSAVQSGIRRKDAVEGPPLDQEMNRLASMIKTLQIDYQRFVVGDLPMPPLEKRDVAQALVRRLRERAKGVAERFRLNSLEAKLNSHIERYGREVRKREQSVEVAPAPRSEPQFDPREGVVVSAQSSQAAEKALYDALYGGRSAQPSAADLDRFRAHLRRNVEMIQAKTGCAQVSFRIATENGKTKLKAKPIRAAG